MRYDIANALRAATDDGITRSNFYADMHLAQTKAEILANPALADVFEDYARKAQDYRAAPITDLPFHEFKQFDTTGNRLQYEARYFARRGRLMTFALLAWLHGREQDIAALEDIIWAICGEYSWALPAHMSATSLDGIGSNETTIDLFAAETGFALAETLHLVGDKLAPLVVERATREIWRRTLDSYMAHAGPQRWEEMENNWCAVCAGSLGSTALYLMQDNAQLAALLNRLAPTFERFLHSFTDDGACVEGLGYWTYGVSFYVAYADLLNRRTGERVDLLDGDKVHRIARFQHICYFPGGHTLSFADGSDHDHFRRGLTCYLARRFDDVHVPPRARAMRVDDDNCYRFCNGLRDLLWANAELLDGASPVLQACTILPAAQWLICRGAGATVFAGKGGHNDEPHNHNDVGHFIYHKGGEALLVDLGAGEYTREYFNEQRYTIFCNNSFSHSVPIINGQGQEAGAHYAAARCSFDASGSMTLDLASAYACADLRELQRTLAFDQVSGSLSLRDCYAFAAPVREVRQRFVTLHAPRSTATGMLIGTDTDHCTIRCASNAAIEVSMHQHSTHSGKVVPVYTVDYVLANPPLAFALDFTIA